MMKATRMKQKAAKDKRAKGFPTMEGMEPRLLLDGTVMATAVGATLKIYGDNEDNQITITRVNDVIAVTGKNGTDVISRGEMAGINNITIKMKGGDDTVVIGSEVALTGRFYFHGGTGDNELLNLNGEVVAAEGSIEILGADDVAAEGAIHAWNDEDVTPGTEAAVATGWIHFDETEEVHATGSITIDSLVGTKATGAIAFHAFEGSAAVGYVHFLAQLLPGGTITLNDGNSGGADPAHEPVIFTAVDELSDPAVRGEFLIGQDLGETIDNFVAAVNLAEGAGDLNIEALKSGDFEVRLTNTVNGAAGNQDILISTELRLDKSENGLTGGGDPVSDGDSVTLNDGVNPAVTFTARANAAPDNAATATATAFTVAGDVHEKYPAGRQFLAEGTVDGLNDGVKTVATGGATFAGGVTTIPVTTALTPAEEETGTLGPLATEFLLDPEDEEATLASLADAINAYEDGGEDLLAIVATFDEDSIDLENENVGSDGNEDITTTGEQWVVTGMAGGVNDFLAGDTVTLNDGTNPAVTFTARDWKEDDAATATATAFTVAGDVHEKYPAGRQFLAEGTVDGLNDGVKTVATGGATFAGGVTTIPVTTALTPAEEETGTLGLLATEFLIGEDENETAQNLAGAIDALRSGDPEVDTLLIDVVVDGNTINLTNVVDDPEATHGNQLITATGEQWTVEGMAGGADAYTAQLNDKIILNDGINAAVTFTAVAAPTPGAPEFALAVTAEEIATNLANAINGLTGPILISAVVDADMVYLTNDRPGAHGNQEIILVAGEQPDPPPDPLEEPENIAAGDMADGADATEDVVELTTSVQPGDFVILNDGQNPAVVFMAVDTVVTPRGNEFAIGEVAADSIANLVATINAYTGSTLGITASVDPGDANVALLVNDTLGSLGNQDIEDWAEGLTVDDMAGGADADPVQPGDTVTLNDGVNEVTFTAVEGTPGANEFQIGETMAETAENLAAAINANAPLGITAAADGTEVLLTADVAGMNGNQPILVTGGHLNAEEMMGGQESGELSANKLDVILGNGRTGDNVLDLMGGTFGTVSIRGGSGNDVVSLEGATVTGRTNILLGSGDDMLTIDASSFKDFKMDAGRGDDLIVIDGAGVGSTFNANTINFRTGGGDDLITDSALTKYQGSGKKSKLNFTGRKGDAALLNDDGLSLGILDSITPVYKFVNGVA